MRCRVIALFFRGNGRARDKSMLVLFEKTAKRKCQIQTVGIMVESLPHICLVLYVCGLECLCAYSCRSREVGGAVSCPCREGKETVCEDNRQARVPRTGSTMKPPRVWRGPLTCAAACIGGRGGIIFEKGGGGRGTGRA